MNKTIALCCIALGCASLRPPAAGAAEAPPSVMVNDTPSANPVANPESSSVLIPTIPGVPKIFLPDIGLAGDFAFGRNNLPKTDPRYSASQQQPRIRDGQAVFYSPIDPYTNAQLSIDLPEDGPAVIEEAWLYFNRLPGNTSVRVGRFLPQYGLIDRDDTFQLPFLDRPNAIANYLGSDGLNGTGVEFNTYVPNPFDWNLKLNMNAVRGDTLGGPTETLDLAYLATLDYSSDLFTSGSMQAGVSVAQGPSPFGRSETLTNPYMQIQFAPTQRKIWTWSAEGMLADRRGLGDEEHKNGFYTFLDYNVGLRYHLGMLVDMADQSIAPYGEQLNVGPNGTWFVSDNTRLRLQYTHGTPLANERPEDKVTLQVTFSLGNLKQMD